MLVRCWVFLKFPHFDIIADSSVLPRMGTKKENRNSPSHAILDEQL